MTIENNQEDVHNAADEEELFNFLADAIVRISMQEVYEKRNSENYGMGPSKILDMYEK